MALLFMFSQDTCFEGPQIEVIARLRYKKGAIF